MKTQLRLENFAGITNFLTNLILVPNAAASTVHKCTMQYALVHHINTIIYYIGIGGHTFKRCIGKQPANSPFRLKAEFARNIHIRTGESNSTGFYNFRRKCTVILSCICPILSPCLSLSIHMYWLPILPQGFYYIQKDVEKSEN